MIGTLPSLIGLQAYLAHAFRNLGGLGLQTWMPFAFQTDNRIWKRNGRIVTPSTEVISANGSRIDNGRGSKDAIANRLRVSRGHSAATQIGALLELAATNTLLRSEQIDDGVYTKDNLTITTNTTAAPDGQTTADKLVETAVLSNHRIVQTQAVTTGNDYAWAFFVKAAGRTKCFIQLGGNGFPGGPKGTFDLSNGTIISSADVNDVGILPLANGWFRIFITATSDNTIGSHTARLNVLDDAGAESYLGDVTKGIFAWGGQFEQTSLMTSYIPTVASSVTRAADNLQYSNASEVLIEAAESTTIVVVVPDVDITDASDPLTIIDTKTGSGANGITIRGDDFQDVYSASIASGGSVSALLQSSTTIPVRGEPAVLVVAAKLNNFRFDINGVQEAIDTAGPAPVSLNANFFVGQSKTNTRQWSGIIAHVLTFNRHLTTRQANDVIKNWIQPIYPGRLRMVA